MKTLLLGPTILFMATSAQAQGFFGGNSGCFPGPSCPPAPRVTAAEVAAAKRKLANSPELGWMFHRSKRPAMR